VLILRGSGLRLQTSSIKLSETTDSTQDLQQIKHQAYAQNLIIKTWLLQIDLDDTVHEAQTIAVVHHEVIDKEDECTHLRGHTRGITRGIGQEGIVGLTRGTDDRLPRETGFPWVLDKAQLILQGRNVLAKLWNISEEKKESILGGVKVSVVLVE
jgi:hypothetical protein